MKHLFYQHDMALYHGIYILTALLDVLMWSDLILSEFQIYNFPRLE